MQLGRLFGIQIIVHPSFLMLPLIFGVIYGYQYGMGVGIRAFVLVVLVFACILGHELSHSLMAKKFGIEVPQITLYMIGGVAGMKSIPKEPKKEFMITIVGPLFNFAIAAIAFLPLYLWMGPANLFGPTLSTWPGMVANLFWINPILGLFNLLPAFPMDGGRILRSILACWVTYYRATRISVYFGYFFAILFAFAGFAIKNWLLVFISVFVFISASNEEKRTIREDKDNEPN